MSRKLARANGENKRELRRTNLALHGETVRKLYVDDGLSQAEVAKIIGVSQTSVKNWLRALSIPARAPANYGSKNGRYKDGTEARPYEKLVDKEHCARCGATTELLVHHKDGNHQNNEILNLEVLCSPCHSRFHKSAYWAARPPKTSCVNGHPLSGANLYVNRKGHRGCKICRKAASARGEVKRVPRGQRT
jgi:transposase